MNRLYLSIRKGTYRSIKPSYNRFLSIAARMSLGNVKYAAKVESYSETHLIPTKPGLVHVHEKYGRE